MAPTTRRSQQANGVKSVKKAPARKTRTNPGQDAPESWDLSIARTRSGESREAPRAQDRLDESIERNEDVQAAIVPTQTLDDAIHPLREMAEKVGREVETFAEDLDKFLGSLSSRNKFEAVLDLVDNFKNVAQDAAAALEENHRKELSQQLREEWRPEIESSSAAKTLGALSSLSSKHVPLSITKARHVQALRNWQQEADIWELFRIILEVHHNPDKKSIQRRKAQALSELGPSHRYTDEGELWTRFLIDNDVARERSKIKSWLEQAVDHQHSDLPDITQELELQAGRGKGLWAHGWLHTREKVKHEKRLRPWSNKTDANPPQIKRSDNGASLVTQLDPDATTRQNRSLESQDDLFEQAMWIACWEMLRRGKTWEEVSAWCNDRKEGWRTLAIGRAADSSSAVSNVVWRKMCFLASQSECCNKYEAAVYGLLGGNAAAVQKICRTVDEQLYAYYSATLTKQFDQYLASQFPTRLPNQRPPISEDDLKNPQDAITELIVKLRSQDETSRESGQPMKIVQSYLLANEAESLVHTIGFALSDNDKLTKKSADEEMMVRLGQLDSLPEAEAAVDPHVLRITAHIGIILNVLSSDMLEGDERDAEENVLVAYIQALRAARKRDLIPLYASRLQLARYVVSVSRVMQDITEVREQEQTLKLLEHYRLDVIMILKEQLAFLLNRLTSKSIDERPFVLLESTSIDTLYPGKRIIAGALPAQFTSEDEAVVQSLKWFHIMHGRWNETFQALSHALRRCLLTGRIASAMMIVEEFPYETVSIRKSYQVVGKSVNLMDHDGPAPEDEQPMWDLLKRQSQTYYELELLVNTIKALADWREKEQDYTNKTPKLSSAPPALRAAKDTVDELMAPILAGILRNPLDETEGADLESIRKIFIPEIVLAYNTILHSAGSLISRDNLIQSMDLSTTIAQEDNNIAECFIQARRMRELVTSFAETSKAMLILKEAGRPWRPKKDREGKDLGLWEIGPQSHKVGDLSSVEQRMIQIG